MSAFATISIQHTLQKLRPWRYARLLLEYGYDVLECFDKESQNLARLLVQVRLTVGRFMRSRLK